MYARRANSVRHPGTPIFQGLSREVLNFWSSRGPAIAALAQETERLTNVDRTRHRSRPMVRGWHLRRASKTCVSVTTVDARAGKLAGEGQPVTAARSFLVFDLTRDGQKLCCRLRGRARRRRVMEKSLADGREGC